MLPLAHMHAAAVGTGAGWRAGPVEIYQMQAVLAGAGASSLLPTPSCPTDEDAGGEGHLLLAGCLQGGQPHRGLLQGRDQVRRGMQVWAGAG